jgi:hypothetical protein
VKKDFATVVFVTLAKKRSWGSTSITIELNGVEVREVSSFSQKCELAYQAIAKTKNGVFA